MAKNKSKPDKKLYESLRGSGVRKKVAAKVSEAAEGWRFHGQACP